MSNTFKVTCEICGSEYEISARTMQRHRNDKSRVFRCKSCQNKYKSELNKEICKNKTDEQKLITSQRISDSKKEWYKNTSQERLNEINSKISDGNKNYWYQFDKETRINMMEDRYQKLRDYWDNISEEDMNIYKEKLSEISSKWWHSLSKEEQNYHLESLYKGRDNWYNNLSDKEKKLRAAHVSEYWNSLPEEEQERRINLLKLNYRNWYDNLSAEELYIFRKKNRNTWANRSDEDFIKWHYDAAMSKINSNILQDKKTDTEIIFMDYLKLNNIPYEYQWFNKTYPSEFHDEFDISYSPFHVWDFCIHTTQADILIDIDGSQHTLQPGEFITKNKLDVGMMIQENDSKRIYQTDGLEAYIIQAYLDNITLHTPVCNVVTKKYMTFEDLINYLNGLNLSDSEIKSLIKKG